MTTMTSVIGFSPIVSFRLSTTRWFLFFLLFTSVAIAAPAACHQFGIAGSVLLPLHFVVILSAMIMGIRGGILTALASLMISNGISHMPPNALLVPMSLELTTYAAVAGWLLHHRRMRIMPALVLTLVFGRCIAGISLAFGLTGAIPNASEALDHLVIIGLPGIALQLLLLPPAVRVLTHFLRADRHEA